MKEGEEVEIKVQGSATKRLFGIHWSPGLRKELPGTSRNGGELRYNRIYFASGLMIFMTEINEVISAAMIAMI